MAIYVLFGRCFEKFKKLCVFFRPVRRVDYRNTWHAFDVRFVRVGGMLRGEGVQGDGDVMDRLRPVEQSGPWLLLLEDEHCGCLVDMADILFAVGAEADGRDV